MSKLLKTLFLIGGVSARFWRDPRQQITVTVTSWPSTLLSTSSSSMTVHMNVSSSSGVNPGGILTKTVTQVPIVATPPPPSPLSPPPVPWETNTVAPVPWETNSGPASAPSASTPIPIPLPTTATHATLATPLPPLQPSGSPVPSPPSSSLLPASGSPGAKCGKGYTYCGYMLASSNHSTFLSLRPCFSH
ncbi:hypothetical protein F5Y18DRAFT_123135 [Xylariaceae sp. FL1019]|nr:hypothetical protein F5Y18DRAFT_123135 [Xylariaceae sp. FL1019]